MKLHDLSKPSGKESRGKAQEKKRKRALRSPESIRKHMKQQADQIEQQLDAKGTPPTYDQLTDFRRFLKGAIAAVQPFNPDGSRRDDPGRSMDMFLRVSELFVRTCAVLLPFERPRLAQIAFRDDTDRRDEGPYPTVWEMRTRLIKNGIPVDHLDGPKLIEHRHAGTGNGQDDDRGGSSVY
jgi:hypothetical protein